MAKIKSAKDINELREYSKEIGAFFPTDKKMIQDNPKVSNIIYPSGIKKSGQVMTYDESVTFNTKYGGKILTIEEYESSIKELNKMLSGYGSKGAITVTLYNDNIERLKAMNDFLGTNYNVSGMNKADFNAIMKQASTITKSSDMAKGNYTFFDVLSELLEIELNPRS